MRWMVGLWPWVILALSVYCIVQVVRDLRTGSYIMAVAGVICIALLLLTPIPSRAVKYDVIMPPHGEDK